MRRTERLFALAEALRARRGGVTAESLAERFGVSVRTIYRDLDSLREAELPIRADRGRGGGYALEKGYQLPPVNFTAREAAVLAIAARLVEELRVVPLADTLRSALDKVRGALDGRGRAEVDRLSATLSFVGVPARAPAPEVRRLVEQAWLEDRPLWIRYGGSRGPSERVIRVLRIVMERTETLLDCEDTLRGGERRFRLHCIEAARWP